MMDIYRDRLGLGKADMVRIEHDDAMVAHVFRVGEEAILKVCPRPNDYLRELYFLRRLQGVLPVAKIMGTVDPEEGVHGAILMQCLRGALMRQEECREGLAYETGQLLARVHMCREEKFGDAIRAETLCDDPRLHYREKFEEEFSECVGHLPKELLEKVRGYFEQHVDELLDVDGPCIVHRDFRPGNIIVFQGKIQGIIDWARARLSFSQEDFCLLEHMEWEDLQEGKVAFLEGYASVRPVPDYGGIMPLLRLSKAIGVVGFLVKSGKWRQHERLYRNNRHYLEMLISQ